MTSQTEEIPALRVCALIRSFFGILTANQWLHLIRGKPDQTTKALLVDLIVNIIQNCSTALQTYVKKTNAEVTKELVKSSLGNTVTDSFKAALDVTAQGQSRSAEALRDMISEEVMVSVQCSMSDAPKEHIPAPRRLDKMLKLVSKMIKTIKKQVFTSRTKGDDVESDEPTTSSQLPQLPHMAETPEEVSSDTSSEDKCLRDSGSSLHIFVKKTVPEPEESEKAESETVEEKTPEVKKRFWYDTSSSEDKGSSDSGSSLLIRIKPYKGKKTVPEPEESESETGEEKPLVKKRCWYDTTSSEDKGSSDSGSSLLICVKTYNSKKTVPEPEESEKTESKTVEEKKVHFWYDTSSSEDNGSEDSASAVPSATPAEPSEEEKRKNTILLVLQSLVSLIYLRTKMRNLTDPASFIERLMKRTWAAVEGIDFDSSPKTVANLEKTLFKDLVKKWGGAELVLLNMIVESQALEKFIADAVIAHLVAPPKKRSCICRFFSSVGRAIASICKRSETVY